MKFWSEDEQLKNIYRILGTVFFILWIIGIVWGFKIGKAHNISAVDSNYREELVKAEKNKDGGLLLADKIATMSEYENLETVSFQNKVANKRLPLTNYSPVYGSPVVPQGGFSASDMNREFYKGLKEK